MPNTMPDIRAVNEALRRAREMQSRSAPPPKAPSPPEPPILHESVHNQPLPAPRPAEKAASPLDILLKDKERTLILVLLILLSSEGNNTELLFALMYLLI